jgi:hypothetical protein
VRWRTHHAGPRARRKALAILVGAACLIARPVGGGVPQREPAEPQTVAQLGPGSHTEYRYRIEGKIRLALFWVGRDDVGGARLTWRADAGRTEFALLAGSDPDRAPRRLNQWLYLREEQRARQGSAFVLRSVAPDDERPAMPLPDGSGSRFGASCSAMRDERVTTVGTTVTVPDATYRMFADVLDRIASARSWQRRDAPVPSRTEAGFLFALKRALDADAAGSSSAHPVATYVYNGAIFDLSVRGRHALGATRVGTQTFSGLVRLDLSVANRQTGDRTKFAVTYAPSAGPLPVQILYQPSFWLRIELHRDDTADVPADPGADERVIERIRAICGRSLTHSRSD